MTVACVEFVSPPCPAKSGKYQAIKNSASSPHICCPASCKKSIVLSFSAVGESSLVANADYKDFVPAHNSSKPDNHTVSMKNCTQAPGLTQHWGLTVSLVSSS